MMVHLQRYAIAPVQGASFIRLQDKAPRRTAFIQHPNGDIEIRVEDPTIPQRRTYKGAHMTMIKGRMMLDGYV